MKIGIDISQVVYDGSGVARFTNGLTRAIANFGDRHEWHLFFSSLRRPFPAALEPVINRAHITLHKYPFPPLILSRMWNDAHIIDVQRFTGPLDWFITSDWTEPPATCKKATMIHDLAFMRYPETIDERVAMNQKKRIEFIKKETDIIFADSDATRNDVIELLGIDRRKTITNYPGVEVQAEPVKPPTFLPNKRFILSVGKLEPRKNLRRLIEAFIDAEPKDVNLLIVGEQGWGDVPKPATQTSDAVHFLGYVSDAELSYLYGHCFFFIYPSIWEGFGYPVIEAMKHGAAVATSKTSSLGEIAHNHAILFDPENVADISRAITALSTDDALRTSLQTKSKKHAHTFTWERYYQTMIKTLS